MNLLCLSRVFREDFIPEVGLQSFKPLTRLTWQTLEAALNQTTHNTYVGNVPAFIILY